jgi:hypothetical protein
MRISSRFGSRDLNEHFDTLNENGGLKNVLFGSFRGDNNFGSVLV